MNCNEFLDKLDAYIDEELDAEMVRKMDAHALECPSCKEELDRAMLLKKLLAHMNDNITMPLDLQAKWRRQVRAEAAKKKKRRIYRFVGTAAAAVAVFALIYATGGVRSVLRPDLKQETVIETDGLESAGTAALRSVPLLNAASEMEEAAGWDQSEPLMMEMAAENEAVDAMGADAYAAADYIDCRIRTGDVENAKAGLDDLISEYEIRVESESGEEDGYILFIKVPGGALDDFVSAMSGLTGDVSLDPTEGHEGEDDVGLRILIRSSQSE